MFGTGSTPPVPSSAEERRRETRQKILDVTLRMIRERGLDKVSWRGIARAVDYSPAGLYEYFDNKDHIVAALAEEGLARLDRALSDVGMNRSPEVRLVGLGEAYIRYAHEHPGYFHLVFSALPSERRSREQPPAGAYRKVFDVMEEGVREGLFRDGEGRDAEVMAYGFWSLVHGMASLQTSALRGFEADFAQADREAMDCFIRGLRQGGS